MNIQTYEVTMEHCEVIETHPQQIENVKNNQFNNLTYDNMSNLLKMMSDPTRLKILHALFLHELCVCDLQSCLNMSQSALSHQLSNLKLARLVTSRREGKNIYYSLNDDHIKVLFNIAYEHVLETV
jgi:ArsR family transcriptional regulator, lead/cadmium/zinc/bismuth-responsive transcriptional repressor